MLFDLLINNNYENNVILTVVMFLITAEQPPPVREASQNLQLKSVDNQAVVAWWKPRPVPLRAESSS